MVVFCCLVSLGNSERYCEIDGRMKTLLNSLFVIFFLIAPCASVVSCIGEDEPNQPVEVVQVGDKVPEFEVLLSDGRRFSTKTLGEGVKIIVFFDTGCSDCQAFLPEYQAFVDELRLQDDKMEGV